MDQDKLWEVLHRIDITTARLDEKLRRVTSDQDSLDHNHKNLSKYVETLERTCVERIVRIEKEIRDDMNAGHVALQKKIDNVENGAMRLLKAVGMIGAGIGAGVMAAYETIATIFKGVK